MSWMAISISIPPLSATSPKNNCGLIDLRKAFLEYNLKNNPENKESGILTSDRVHLNDKGNNFVAEKMMEAIIK